MRFSFSFIGILFLIYSIQLVQTQYWNPFPNRCYNRYEQYNQCASTCPDTCQDILQPNLMKLCTQMCRSGCECMRPTVRLNQNPMSPCVLPFRCRFLYRG